MQDPAYLEQFQPPVNIGVLLGEPSDGLISIDLDVADAYREFIKWNPGLEQAFQSAARRGRNLWIRIEGEYPRTFVLSTCNGNGEKTPIGEFRSTGSQTIVFGKHPSGVYYKWLKHSEALRLRYDQIIWPPGWSAPQRDSESCSKGSNPIQQQTGKADPEESKPVTTEQRLYLPNAHVTIPESADALFRLIAPSLTMFKHGRRIVEPVLRCGRIELEQIKPDGFRGRIQKFGAFFTKQEVKLGVFADYPALPKSDHAKILLASAQAQDLLPDIRLVTSFPILMEKDGKVRILSEGYDPETKILVAQGMQVPSVALPEAVGAIMAKFDEFEFESPSDQSRAVGGLLSPALRFGGHIRRRVPVLVIEANDSQAGKGLMFDLIAAVYGEVPTLVARRKGGVGSLDESFDTALLAGRPIVVIDNLRGKLESEHIESFVTCPGDFGVRTLRAAGSVDPSDYIVGITSNGAMLTRDLANRSIMIRIRKREGYAFRQYREGDLLEHVRGNAGYLMGCAFSVLLEWLKQGKPRTNDLRHSFREWSQALDWIVQHIFGLAPLLDHHQAAQMRTADGASSFVRSVAIAVERRNQLGIPLSATAIYELASPEGAEILGLNQPSPEAGKLRTGSLMGNAFGTRDLIMVEGYQCSRVPKRLARGSGDGYFDVWEYTFAKVANPVCPQPVATGP